MSYENKKQVKELIDKVKESIINAKKFISENSEESELYYCYDKLSRAYNFCQLAAADLDEV